MDAKKIIFLVLGGFILYYIFKSLKPSTNWSEAHTTPALAASGRSVDFPNWQPQSAVLTRGVGNLLSPTGTGTGKALPIPDTYLPLPTPGVYFPSSSVYGVMNPSPVSNDPVAAGVSPAVYQQMDDPGIQTYMFDTSSGSPYYV